MQGMIFAAGLGTRLRPLTNDRPKALVEVSGATLLEHNILKLRDAGCDHIVVNVHHFADKVIDFLRGKVNFGMDIQVSDERDNLLDTGGGLRKALSLLRPDEPVLIHNVDIVSDIDLREIWNHHIQQRPAATLAVNDRKTSRYLMFDEQSLLCGWTNVSTGEVKGEIGIKHAFAGIHVVDPQLFPFLEREPADEPFSIVPFYLKVCRNVMLEGFDVTASNWVDCGKIEALEKAGQILGSARNI